MENDLQNWFASQKFILLDGALATELERHGADLNDPLWSAKMLLENPEAIRRVHYDYLSAGADIITTASYQATFEGFAKRGFGNEEAERLLKLSVEVAHGAREKFWSKKVYRDNRQRPLVAASIGPYGAYLADGSEYKGNYGLSIEQLKNFHRNRMKTLWDTAPDLLACETIPCPDEAKALAELLAEFPEAKAWMSFSCRDGQHLSDGTPFAAAVEIAQASPQVVAVGINCTAPGFILPLLEIAHNHTNKPLLAYPNSGEIWDHKHHCWLPGTSGDTWAHLEEWLKAGARLVGGCCRCGPEDIQFLAKKKYLRKTL